MIRNALKDIRESAFPSNGLAIFSGPGVLELIEPDNPLRLSIYKCDKRFHVDAVIAANNSSGTPYGIVVLDGTGILVGVCDGTRRTVSGKIAVDLPSKHGRGGQSALRFSRLAEEARANYITKSFDLVMRTFVREGVPTVCGMVIAGVGDLKHRLVDRITSLGVLTIVSVLELAYGGMDGFMLACKESEIRMGSAVLTREREAVAALEEAISRDTGAPLYALGREHVEAALDAGAVSCLILSNEIPDGEMDAWQGLATASGVDTVQTVSQTTPEGTRFINGLTGIGAILRWSLLLPLPLPLPEENDDEQTKTTEVNEIDFM